MKIKNWKKFQHFKDRRPPWIKLHREILEQRDISLISDCSFRVLIGIWLLASEDEGLVGELPCIDDISFRLRIEKTKLISSLEELEPFLIHDDIDLISLRHQSDSLETETETKTEAKAEAKRARDITPPKKITERLNYDLWPSLPDDDCLDAWLVAKKKANGSVSQRAINTVGKELHKVVDAGVSVEDALDIAENSKWRGFKSEWVLNAKGNQNENSLRNSQSGAANLAAGCRDAFEPTITGESEWADL